MSLNIKPSTKNQRKRLFEQTLLNTTNRVSRITDESVLDGISEGIAAVSGKAEKDIILALSNLYPDNTYGENLDQCAEVFGVASRFTAAQSSTYLRLVADPGTQYILGTHIFSTTNGVQFELENNVTIPSFGFTYTKVRSVDTGSKMNVQSGKINTVSPSPSGHKFVVNEYMADYGRDVENDDMFRKRIKEGANILARGTLSMLDQVFMKINSNYLKTYFQGFSDNGKLKLALVSVNGIDFTSSEINDFIEHGEQYFSLIELKFHGRKSNGIRFRNMSWMPLDISFRCDLFPNFDVDDVRHRIQINISKYLDFRFWKSGDQKIEWDNLLEIVKSTDGVKYVQDETFYPRVDINVNKNLLPRLRGFLMLNLNGSLIRNFSGTLNPVFYPNLMDFNYQQTVLRSIEV